MTKMKNISYRIRYHIAERKISQAKLAKVCGCSKGIIFSYVNGNCREENMDIKILKKMAVYFEKEEYYFCNEYLKFMDTVDVAKWLREKRIERNMTQRCFAASFDIPLNNYKAYEEGKVRLQFPYWENIVKLVLCQEKVQVKYDFFLIPVTD